MHALTFPATPNLAPSSGVAGLGVILRNLAALIAIAFAALIVVIAVNVITVVAVVTIVLGLLGDGLGRQARAWRQSRSDGRHAANG